MLYHYTVTLSLDIAIPLCVAFVRKTGWVPDHKTSMKKQKFYQNVAYVSGY